MAIKVIGQDELRGLAARAADGSAAPATAGPPESVPTLAAVADRDTLGLALIEMRRLGRKAPGPDGQLAHEISADDLDILAEELASGVYEPGRLRRCPIPKANGGVRTLEIPNVRDRLVERAILAQMTPVAEAELAQFVHGFRPGRSPHTALAHAMAIAERKGRFHWLKADLADAFGSIPTGRLMQVLDRLIKDKDLVALIERLIRRTGRYTTKSGQAARGIPQGCPLSPMLLNLYLGHFLDRPGQMQNPGAGLIRYADDLLVLCATEGQIQEAQEKLEDLIQPHGLRVNKQKTRHANLAEHTLEYMGFEVNLDARGQTQADIGENLWNSLETALHRWHEGNEQRGRKAHTRTNNDEQPGEYPQIAWHTKNVDTTEEDVVKGWIGYLGPAIPNMSRDDMAHIADRIQVLVRMSGGYSHMDPADRNEVYSRVHRAGQAWEELRERIETTVNSSRTQEAEEQDDHTIEDRTAERAYAATDAASGNATAAPVAGTTTASHQRNGEDDREAVRRHKRNRRRLARPSSPTHRRTPHGRVPAASGLITSVKSGSGAGGSAAAHLPAGDVQPDPAVFLRRPELAGPDPGSYQIAIHKE